MDKVIYLQPGKMIFDALLDLMELQKGAEKLNDPLCGALSFVTLMYGIAWEIRFKITEIDRTRCAVTIEVLPEERNEVTQGYIDTMTRREQALLDSMLLIGTQQEIERLSAAN